MNIYDEALNKLNELGQETNDEFEGYIIDCYEDWYYTIEKALERAKKVEELKVYQERYIHKLSYGRRSPYDKKYHLEKIAQLKKELETMK